MGSYICQRHYLRYNRPSLRIRCLLILFVSVFLALVIKGVVIIENSRIRLPSSDERATTRSTRFTSSRGGHKGASAVATQMLL